MAELRRRLPWPSISANNLYIADQTHGALD
jgi:hypothetical protein